MRHSAHRSKRQITKEPELIVIRKRHRWKDLGEHYPNECLTKANGAEMKEQLNKKGAYMHARPELRRSLA